jgi:hypothetical protein
MHVCVKSLCLVLLCSVTICEWSLFGQNCVTQSNTVYDQFYTQAITEQMMELWNVNVCIYMYVYTYVHKYVHTYVWIYVCMHVCIFLIVRIWASWSDRPFIMGDIEDKFILLLSTNISSMPALELFWILAQN